MKWDQMMLPPSFARRATQGAGGTTHEGVAREREGSSHFGAAQYESNNSRIANSRQHGREGPPGRQEERGKN